MENICMLGLCDNYFDLLFSQFWNGLTHWYFSLENLPIKTKVCDTVQCSHLDCLKDSDPQTDLKDFITEKKIRKVP
jgi:hypothetical protein